MAVEEKGFGRAVSAEEMALLAGMARPEDEKGTQMPTLKMNYDADSGVERGAWVVGQTKDKDGNVLDKGKIVKGFVILDVKRRYSYYVQTDLTKNCQSVLHGNFQAVRGNRHKVACGPGCTYRDRTKHTPYCKSQLVVFGIAFTAEKEAIMCVSYMQGATYMPFSEYFDKLPKITTTDGKKLTVPFTNMTMLGSHKEKNAGTTYFVGEFTLGKMFEMSVIGSWAKQRDEIVAPHIARINKMVDKPFGSTESKGGTDDYVAPGMEEAAPPVHDRAVREPVGDTSRPSAAAAVPDDDFDIEAAIKSAISGGIKRGPAVADDDVPF